MHGTGRRLQWCFDAVQGYGIDRCRHVTTGSKCRYLLEYISMLLTGHGHCNQVCNVGWLILRLLELDNTTPVHAACDVV